MNTGQTVGVIQTIHSAVELEDIYKSGGGRFEHFDNREDPIPPSLGTPLERETGLDFVIDGPRICWGWIEYEDVFGRKRKQGWKHRLNLGADSAGNYSNPLPGCYSSTYKPWNERRAKKALKEHRTRE